MTDHISRPEITTEQQAYAENALNSMPLTQMIGMKLLGLKLDEAVIGMQMRDDFRQPSGVLHGGITATLIDTAMAFAVRTRLAREEATATIDLTIHYLRPVTQGKVTCTAKTVRAGKRIFTVSADVHNEEGALIASALSTYTRV